MVKAKGEPVDGLYNLLCPNNSILHIIEDNAENRALL
jgi:hypothetical protein